MKPIETLYEEKAFQDVQSNAISHYFFECRICQATSLNSVSGWLYQHALEHLLNGDDVQQYFQGEHPTKDPTVTTELHDNKDCACTQAGYLTECECGNVYRAMPPDSDIGGLEGFRTMPCKDPHCRCDKEEKELNAFELAARDYIKKKSNCNETRTPEQVLRDLAAATDSSGDRYVYSEEARHAFLAGAEALAKTTITYPWNTGDDYEISH